MQNSKCTSDELPSFHTIQTLSQYFHHIWELSQYNPVFFLWYYILTYVSLVSSPVSITPCRFSILCCDLSIFMFCPNIVITSWIFFNVLHSSIFFLCCPGAEIFHLLFLFYSCLVFWYLILYQNCPLTCYRTFFCSSDTVLLLLLFKAGNHLH